MRLQKIRRVLLYTLFLNIAVALTKIVYGYRIDSISMFSDGFHSLFDGISNIIGLIGIFIASRPPDKNHPYGHRKYETLSTIAIAVLIFFAGYEILRKSYFGFTSPHSIDVTSLSFIIMALTLFINTGVMIYEKKKGRELHSDFLLADAMHTNTDIFVSISVVISLVAAKMGYPVIDIISAVIIALFIAKMGIEVLKSAADVLTDAACIEPNDIREVVNKVEGVKGCHEIRTRGKEGAVHIDLHILVSSDLKTIDAHDLAHKVEDAIKQEFPSVIDAVIHTEPHDGNALELGQDMCCPGNGQKQI
ncbi:MAG: cation transporter [Nitrospirae bacterium]|nr:cation transporter [Nitrospirota bacterium]